MSKIHRLNAKYAFLIGFLLICLCIVCFFWYAVNKKSQYTGDKSVIIERQCDDDYVSHVLLEHKVSTNFAFTKLAVKVLKLLRYEIKIGEFILPPRASLLTAIKVFHFGCNVVHKINIPEGFSVAQAVKRIEQNEYLQGHITDIPEEGTLMPDTYVFRYPTTKQHIIDEARRELSEFMAKQWPKRSSNCMLKTPREALIMASIVEKETFMEREMVAGVYANRLKRGMRLQSCPTVIYAITHGFALGRKVLYSDLYVKSPYNTYRNAGLPPTPITNAGKASILAVLHPMNTEYLFFVHDEGSNCHIFSKTYDEHKRRIAEMRQSSSSGKKR